jgi:DNA-binding transcriptional MerR regulator
VKLKKHYTSREVAVLTGLTARQLQWWDTRRLFKAALAPHRTEAGGFTERRYTPLDVLELQVLADLRRRGFSVPRLRRLLTTLRDQFGVRLYEAIGDRVGPWPSIFI